MKGKKKYLSSSSAFSSSRISSEIDDILTLCANTISLIIITEIINIKIYLILLVNMEMQIETMMKYIFYLLYWQKVLKRDNIKP